MSPSSELLDRLVSANAWGYDLCGAAATEPTALVVLALLGHQRAEDAQRGLDWLVRRQNRDGSLGVTAEQEKPRWPTSLAVLAWAQADRQAKTTRYQSCIRRAAMWLLSQRGTTPQRGPHFKHDTRIPGWPWVAGTHSWIEPTAYALAGLTAAGYGNHLRCRHARKLLLDRQLAAGGCNYGNTVVLGQSLRPQVGPTGIALWAMCGRRGARLERGFDYLQRAIRACPAPISFCQAAWGLAAHDRIPAEYERLVGKMAGRALERRPSPYKLAMLALAQLAAASPLVQLLATNPSQAATDYV